MTTPGERHPRATQYDLGWLTSLDMGPNPLWQLEDLLDDVPLMPGDRVLDLGCGRGATSVFLARETGARVTACDLWVPREDLTAHLVEAGVADEVTVVNANARQLPFEDHTFDAIVSIDAFEYFGTDVHTLPELLRVVRPGGRIGMSTPSLRVDPYQERPAKDISALLGPEVGAWHVPEWWATHWELSGLVDDVVARWQTAGAQDWLAWQAALGCEDDALSSLLASPQEPIGFALVSATRR